MLTELQIQRICENTIWILRYSVTFVGVCWLISRL